MKPINPPVLISIGYLSKAELNRVGAIKRSDNDAYLEVGES